jgi:hypothetical protein
LAFVATNKKGTPKLVACNRIRKQTQKQKHLTQPFSKDTHALKIIQAPTQHRKTNTETTYAAPTQRQIGATPAQHLFKRLCPTLIQAYLLPPLPFKLICFGSIFWFFLMGLLRFGSSFLVFFFGFLDGSGDF